MKYFHLPDIKTYITGIPILLILAIIASLTAPITDGNSYTLIAGILAGLFVGHLVGVTIPGRSHRDGSTNQIKTVYVGNLAFNASRHDLTNLFKPYGKVHSSRIMIDRATRKSRGFGFVEMNSHSADAAIAALDGIDFSGRNIRVNEATQQTPHHRR